VPGPEQSTARLTIEPLQPEHAEELHAALADPAVHRYIVTSGPWTLPAVRARLERVAAGPPAGSGDVWLNFAVRRAARLVGRLPWTLPAVRARLERVAAGPPAGSGDVWLNFAVRREARLVGRLESTVHGQLAEIAYLFDPAASGRGYATEAVQWLLGHLHEAHGVTEVWATTDPGNDASIRVLGRTGFTRVDEVHPDVGSYDEGDLVFRRQLG